MNKMRTLLFAATMALAPSAVSAEDFETTLYLGEETGYSGVFCTSSVSARAFLKLVEEVGEKAPLFGLPRGCLESNNNIRLDEIVTDGKAADTGDVWTVVQVQAAGAIFYIVTGLTVLEGQSIRYELLEPPWHWRWLGFNL